MTKRRYTTRLDSGGIRRERIRERDDWGVTAGIERAAHEPPGVSYVAKGFIDGRLRTLVGGEFADCCDADAGTANTRTARGHFRDPGAWATVFCNSNDRS
jgi:hypothetical protein